MVGRDYKSQSKENVYSSLVISHEASSGAVSVLGSTVQGVWIDWRKSRRGALGQLEGWNLGHETKGQQGLFSPVLKKGESGNMLMLLNDGGHRSETKHKGQNCTVEVETMGTAWNVGN